MQSEIKQHPEENANFSSKVVRNVVLRKRGSVPCSIKEQQKEDKCTPTRTSNSQDESSTMLPQQRS